MMEEVDQIILSSFLHMGCEFAEGRDGLKDFTAEEVVEAAVRCLSIIDSDFKMATKFPPGMSARFRAGSSLARACQQTGFKGEIGYQTFLYPSENEIRKVFMHLVEKLPKDENSKDDSGSATSLLRRRISQILKIESQKFWLPTNCRKTFQKTFQFQTINSDESIANLLQQKISAENQMKLIPSIFEDNIVEIEKQKVFKENEDASNDLRSQKDHFSWKNSSSSSSEPKLDLNASYEEVLEKISGCLPASQKSLNSRFILNRQLQLTADQQEEEVKRPVPLPRKKPQKKESSQQSSDQEEEETENEKDLLEVEVDEIKKKIRSALEEVDVDVDRIKENELVVEQMSIEMKNVSEVIAKEKENLKSKSKVVKMLSNSGENLIKLQQLVDKSKDRKEELEKVWIDLRDPLEDQRRSLEETLNNNRVGVDKLMEEIQVMRRRMKETMNESKKKDILIKQMKMELCSTQKETPRHNYTRRILEIVASIHKQKKDIQKILEDTRETQKITNQLRERIDRTFAITDEVIFKDAKRDDEIRQAYKLLVALHDDCVSLLTTVEDTGSIVCEIRELEQQIAKEESKNASENLAKIICDYKELKKENSVLIKKLKQL